MVISAEVAAHRILQKLPTYKNLRSSELSEEVKGISEGHEEEILGIYFNQTEEKSKILVTTKGICFIDREKKLWTFYNEMDSISMGENGKESDKILIRKKDGTRSTIIINGRRERFNDALEFQRFLMRVVR
ncbi:hypothetical protein KXS07_01725 [Inquilinus limosus]|uniref:hypothetical protein n=1 Tax=Inquilinus limosus TaxID=171674 RepID=UPI003F149084